MDNNRNLKSTTTFTETTASSTTTTAEVTTTTPIVTSRICADAINALTAVTLVDGVVSCVSPPTSTTISLEPAGANDNATSQSVQIQDIAQKRKSSHVHFTAMMDSTDTPTSSGMVLSQLSQAAAAAAAAAAAVLNNNNNNTGNATPSANESATVAPSTSAVATAAAAAAVVVAGGDKDERPSLSYKDLIIEAIQSSREKRLKLSEIYQVIRDLHPYYSRRADQWGWQNSIRHNLSLHDCFIKLPLKQTSASGVVVSGHFWTVVSESEEKQGSPTRRRSRANTSGVGKHAGGKSAKLRGVHNNHNNVTNGTTSGNSTTALNLNGTIGTEYGSSLATQASSVAVTNVFFNGTSTHPTSTPTLSVGATPTMSTKIKGRQSVSSDSGVMSDESQSSSPTSSTTTAVNASSLLQQTSLLNGLMLNGMPTAATVAGGMTNLPEQLQNHNNHTGVVSDALRKTSSAIFACPSTSASGINGLRVHAKSANTSPDGKNAHHYNNLTAHHQQPQPQLPANLRQFITPDAFQLLTSAISSTSSPISLAQNQQQCSQPPSLTTASNSSLTPLLSSIASGEGSVNTNATVQAVAALFQQNNGGAQQLPVANSTSTSQTLAQFLETTCKNRLLADIFQQQQQQQSQQQAQSGGVNSAEQLNTFLLPLLNAISANGSATNASLIPPILNRVAALRTALGSASPLNGVSSMLAGNNAGSIPAGLDGAIGDLLTSSSLNSTANLANLSFLQYFAYQQSIIQQFLSENNASNAATSPAAGLLGLIGAQNGQLAAPNDQIMALLTQLQQQQQSSLNICQTAEQQPHSGYTFLRQLLAKFSNNSLQHHANSQQQQPQTTPQPPASAPPVPLNAGGTGSFNGTDFGAILAAASNNIENASGDVSSSQSPFNVKSAILPVSTNTVPSIPQRQQLLDMFLMEQQQRQQASQQHLDGVKNEVKDEPMDYETTIKTPLESDLQHNICKASPNSLGDFQLQLEAANHQQHQQHLMNSLIEQYILQNGARLSAASSGIGPVAASDATTEEGVVSTTTTVAGLGGDMPSHVSQSPKLAPYSPVGVPSTPPASSTNFTANFIAAAITAAASTNITTTTMSNGPSQ